MKIAGVCAALYGVGLVAFLGLLGSTGIMSANDMSDILRLMMEHHATVMFGTWLYVALPLPLAVAGLGCLATLRKAGHTTWIAALAFIGGSFLALLRNAVWLAMAYKLAPAYVTASAADQGALLAVGETLRAYGFVIGDLVGGFLIGVIGIPLFSAAILRSDLAPRWVGWLGFAVGIFTACRLFLAQLDKTFAAVLLLGMPLLVIWMIAIGIALWRAPEPGVA